LIKYGPGKLLDSELLAILLRTGSRGVNVVELGKKILQKFPHGALANTSVEELRKVHGLGLSKACEIVACFELGRRKLKDKQAALIISPQKVWEQLKDIRDNKKEHFVVFYLDTQNQETLRDVVSVGTLNANLVHPREVFEKAVQNCCASVLVAHNHPSGSLEPSEEDLAVTKRLVDAGKILGIDVLDHVIVTKTGCYSLKEHNLL